MIRSTSSEPLRIAAHVIARYARIEGQVRRFEATVDACAEATGPDVLARARAADEAVAAQAAGAAYAGEADPYKKPEDADAE